MKIYIVTSEEMDDMGNYFNDFHGVFSKKEEAEKVKNELDIKDLDTNEVIVECAEILEYDF